MLAVIAVTAFCLKNKNLAMVTRSLCSLRRRSSIDYARMIIPYDRRKFYEIRRYIERCVDAFH